VGLVGVRRTEEHSHSTGQKVIQGHSLPHFICLRGLAHPGLLLSDSSPLCVLLPVVLLFFTLSFFLNFEIDVAFLLLESRDDWDPS
jgi:hypothetical protein